MSQRIGRFISVSAVVFAAGCSEYDLTGSQDPNDIPDDPVTTCGTLDLDRDSIETDPSCEVAVEVGSFTPIIKAQNPSLGDGYTTPVVGQLTDDNGDGLVNGNDMPDIVYANGIGVVYAVSNDLLHIHWQTGTIYDSYYGMTVGDLGTEPATPAIGDVNGDGRPDVVAAGQYGIVAIDGSTGHELWRLSSIPGTVLRANCGAVGLYDLDGDGAAEVVFGRTILNGRDGTTRGIGGYGEGSGHAFAAPMGAAADINNDGKLEVIVGNAAYDDLGNALWHNGFSDGFVAVANFDSDAEGEIVVTWQGSVRLQDSNGALIWQLLGVLGDTSGPPTVADFDGDGKPEIGIAGHNVYMVVETNGTIKWQNAVHDESSGFTGSSVFDFEGDGRAEVVYADENDVWVYDGATGAVKMQQTQHSSATCSEYPSIADVDKDGHAEILYSSSQYFEGTQSGVTIIGDAGNSWVAGRQVWNSHAYAITNIESDSSWPTSFQPNWPDYNNWRSGDVTAISGNKSADAVALEGDICASCDTDFATVVVRVGNGGMDDLAAGTPVSVYAMQGGAPILVETRPTENVIEAGDTSLGMRFDIPTDQLVDGDVRVVVDDAGTGVGIVDECHEDNNTLTIDVCGG